MANNRVFYAVHSVGFAEYTAGSHTPFTVSSGVQSVGVNTTFNLEQVFQLGQIEIYENIENIPNVEVTIEKVLDGGALLQHLATQGAASPHLSGRYNNERCNVAISFYPDTNDSATGSPSQVVAMSGMYVSSMNFSFPVDGNFTESVTLVGNHKAWSSLSTGGWAYVPTMDNDDSPLGASGVLRRQDLSMSGCVWPLDIPGTAAHTGAAPVYTGGGMITGPTAYPTHVQSVNISVDLGRTELFELGRRGPYHRFADFPTEVTTAIEIIETELGDSIDAFEETANVSNQPIYLELVDLTRIYLGTKNKLSSVSSSGGDTGGGNRTTTYNYSNFNKWTITHPLDPAAQTATS